MNANTTADAPPATPHPSAPIRIHRSALSGHCHRVELFSALLGLPVTLIDVDLRHGEQKTPAFLAMHPFGLVPVLQDGETTLWDSNAILVYLALRYGNEQWLPRDPAGAAAVQAWLSVAAGPLAFGPAAARLVTLFKAPFELADVSKRAAGLLAVMDKVLGGSPFLTGRHPTLADIANYSYVALAPEGKVALAPYPQVRAWLARIESLPGFVAMQRTSA